MNLVVGKGSLITIEDGIGCVQFRTSCAGKLNIEFSDEQQCAKADEEATDATSHSPALLYSPTSTRFKHSTYSPTSTSSYSPTDLCNKPSMPAYSPTSSVYSPT